MTTRILTGDVRAVLKTLADDSVDCCISSPPYWGLRSYLPADHPQKHLEIGSEPTVQEWVQTMVEVFHEVRRVLKPSGTLWLNLGDSYAGTRGGAWGTSPSTRAARKELIVSRRRDNHPVPRSDLAQPGLKPKDMVGQPWRVAFALQEPYYTGRMKDECDRVWMAAMVDAEGSICGTEYESGGRTHTSLFITVTNTSVPIIEKCQRLFPQDLKHVYEKTNGNSGRRCFRWDVEQMAMKSLFIREIYPHLVAKRKQAMLGYTFLEMQSGLLSKKKGYLPEQQEKRTWMMAALSKLNHGEDVDLPDWVKEPPTLFEPGFYLRQEIIWAKRSPMPESVRDRFTKSHEHVFLLAKSQTYYFDFDAIQEPASEGTKERYAQAAGKPFGMSNWARGDQPHDAHGLSAEKVASKHQKYRPVGTGVGFGHGFDEVQKPRVTPKAALATSGNDGAYADGKSERTGRGAGWRNKNNTSFDEAMAVMPATRNPRSVRWLSSEPFRGAHFATFPAELIRPFVRAGCPPGGVVLDPFGGSGTTGLVADQEGRNAILIDLDERNAPMAEDRITASAPLLAKVERG